MLTRKLGPDGPIISAVGFGGMLVSISGRPPEDQAIDTIHAALDAGVTLIDTADAYCLDEHDFHHNEQLIRKALKSRKEAVLVATKVGCRRPGGAWTVDGRPELLAQAIDECLDALGVRAIDLLQLHAPDARVPFADSVGALAEAQKAGKARFIGLSNVTVQQIEQARKIVPIVSVQNRWNPMDRSSERDGVLEYCQNNGLTFLAYSPLGGSREAPILGTLGRIAAEARRRRVSPHRLVLAWMLAKSPAVVPIPGARRPQSITDSAAAADMRLGPEDIARIEAAFP